MPGATPDASGKDSGRFSLVRFSVDHPRLVLGITALLTLLSLVPLPKIRTDTNPKNMLPPTAPVRVRNAEVERTFVLREDMIAVGIQNDAGVLQPATLGTIYRVTQAILKLPGVVSEDVTSFVTITNVRSEAGTVYVEPLMPEPPTTPEGIAQLRRKIFTNPLLLDRIVSRDGRMTAIFVPIEKGANGKVIADQIRDILRREHGSERFYVAGDPVARDTFGAEMFRLMAVFSPVAALVMFIAIYFMFRSFLMAASMLAVAMVAILWSIGALVALGFPVHIMSSMSPVFLMAIATDSIHIFNEFMFRRREAAGRREAVLATMDAVSRPVRYTALATAAGFAVLLFMTIVPVKVFGGVIVFGTLALRLLSFSFIPAVLMLLPSGAAKAAPDEKAAPGAAHGPGAMGRFVHALTATGTRRPRVVLGMVAVVLALSIAGMTRIVVNNNMIGWFKPSSELRRADRAVNASLGGTSLAYIVATSARPEGFNSPEALRTLEALQARLAKLPVVGKTTSVADYVKRINRELNGDDPRMETIPADAGAVGQCLFLFSSSARSTDLVNVIDDTYTKANVWVQLRTWDASAMRDVLHAVDDFKKSAPPWITFTPAGIAYFNLVWNDEVLGDMIRGFALALIAVFVILAVNFRSVRWALIGCAPLLVTILVIYGVVGWSGKQFDMPIAVLSCLSLGMAVDFSIHFIGRFQQRRTDAPSEPPAEALLWTADRPGRGILRNAVLFAASFAVMLFAPLTPYVTVGAFIVAMMLLSALFTLLLVPALIVTFQRALVAPTR
ncbi:MAG TPA: MMPL family transporter [Candidatus Eisenbacteria bacterium]|nr:MMPL family transporter [Candidatus Eisenbacteria bacterium]